MILSNILVILGPRFSRFARDLNTALIGMQRRKQRQLLEHPTKYLQVRSDSERDNFQTDIRKRESMNGTMTIFMTLRQTRIISR